MLSFNMRECTECHEVKPLLAFSFRKDKQSYRNKCKGCTNTKALEYKSGEWTPVPRNPLGPRDTKLLKTYGITSIEYTIMYEQQGGCCAICNTPAHLSNKKMAVDHDHAYAVGDRDSVRGLLCNGCNLAIGLLKDNSAIVLAAAGYLKSHGK
tara:strand:+ start:292 stop:747 length:456 start_codon:yes stop_codon:yes gene_type:complete